MYYCDDYNNLNLVAKAAKFKNKFNEHLTITLFETGNIVRATLGGHISETFTSAIQFHHPTRCHVFMMRALRSQWSLKENCKQFHPKHFWLYFNSQFQEKLSENHVGRRQKQKELRNWSQNYVHLLTLLVLSKLIHKLQKHILNRSLRIIQLGLLPCTIKKIFVDES